MRIRIIWEGRTKNRHLGALEADYRERIAHFTELVVEEVRPGSPPKRLLEKLRGSAKVFLDGRGREWTSEEFAEWLGQMSVRGTREIAFLVGGPEGLSEAFRNQADTLLALSRMTLTHEWARVLLLEQIYRGFTILRGYPYAR